MVAFIPIEAEGGVIQVVAHAKIGSNTAVLTDIPSGARYAGVRAKQID
jgi:serine acetyltransferase